MTRLSFDTIEPASPITALPARLEQTTSTLGDMVRAALAVLATLLLVVPLSIVAAHVSASPDVASDLATEPGAALRIALGLTAWTALLGVPLHRVLTRMAAARRVVISDGSVAVTESSLFGRASFEAPLDSYAGIAHHIRASLSGNRHELILVHPDPARSVLIAIAPRFVESDIQRLCALLGLREVPAKALYTRGRMPDLSRPAASSALHSQQA